MSLEELPTILGETFDAHSARFRNEEEYKEYMSRTYNYLLNHNKPLFSIIEATARSCENPAAVREAAYAVLNMVGDQLEANKLNGHLKQGE